MAIVIQFPNRKMTTLKEARRFLGGGFFRKALLEWSLEELQRTISHPEACLTDAGDCYEAILRSRLSRMAPAGPEAEVIPFPERKAA